MSVPLEIRLDHMAPAEAIRNRLIETLNFDIVSDGSALDRANDAGVEIMETRITDLAYAPEIAESMLRRQQAAAIVAARKKIVEGAVLMVRDAVAGLAEGDEDHESIALDEDRKATFAANLMTVIASDQPTSPVVNVGTLTR